MSCGWIAGGGGGRKAPGYTTQKATMELAIDFSRLLDYTTRKTSIGEQNKLAALQMESLVVVCLWEVGGEVEQIPNIRKFQFGQLQRSCAVSCTHGQ
ncbi:hypothetical protein DY000_02023104 [Brassica cretica]|uniref:Uncharacterized protein n=1 Tax=Brassica cretica TaxID=69181 RepID=A0ABQ7ED90_BRACR|nr:hypothetical protein DY000_02023104 [Brassica cretica]